jgi:hypothetical protein
VSKLTSATTAAEALVDEIYYEGAQRAATGPAGQESVPHSTGPGLLRRREPLLVLRTEFVRLDPTHPGNDCSPLGQIMGRSKGWSHGTAAKLYVLLLWRTTNLRPGDAVALELTPARIGLLADVIGVTRRVLNDAIRHLDEVGFLDCQYGITRHSRDARTQTDTPGPIKVRTGAVQCLSELGTRRPHQAPDRKPWFALGPGLITEGWLARLNGAAFAVLLVMASRLNLAAPTTPIWVASTQIAAWYGFSHEVWKRGIDQLLDEQFLRRYTPYNPDLDVRDRRIKYSIEIKRDWIAPYADRVSSSPGFTPRRAGEPSYSYRTAYIPAVKITPSRLDQLAVPEGPATKGDPCRMCANTVPGDAHWIHKDRHVCSAACNDKLKKDAGLSASTRGPRPNRTRTRDMPYRDPHRMAEPGTPCRVCRHQISKKTHWKHRDLHVCSNPCYRTLIPAPDEPPPGLKREL